MFAENTKIATPPLPQGGSKKVLVPRPGSGLPCPPVPTVVLPPLTCPRPPYLRRSGRRSCCSGGDPDGDATVVANKSRCAFLTSWSPLVLPIILTVCRCFNKYHLSSTGRHPLARQPVISGPFGPSAAPSPTPGPHYGRPGQPFLKQRAGPGPSAQTAGSEPLEALSLPTPAPSHHLSTPRMRAVARTPANPPAPPEMIPR